MPEKFFKRLEFISLEALGGLILIVCTVLAMMLNNSSLHDIYHWVLNMPFQVTLGEHEWGIKKSVHLWINDGLMVLFFFMVGLELKREFCVGALKSKDGFILPLAGALGGMVGPSLVFSFFCWSFSELMHGWAIPVATDIAFALGLLCLFGSRVPTPVKVFLLTLAVIDDLGAILIIAATHSHHLSLASLSLSSMAIFCLYFLNRHHYDKLPMYLFVGLFLWFSVLKSGIHATLAGVILALFIPYNKKDGSPFLSLLEHDLHPLIIFVVLPLFALANAGVSFAGLEWSMLTHPLVLGITFGLFFGKQIGIVLCAWIAHFFVKDTYLSLPLSQLYGIASLCGMGFTMSLFIGGLAFGQNPELLNLARLGILSGTFLSAIWGLFILHLSLPPAQPRS